MKIMRTAVIVASLVFSQLLSGCSLLVTMSPAGGAGPAGAPGGAKPAGTPAKPAAPGATAAKPAGAKPAGTPAKPAAPAATATAAQPPTGRTVNLTPQAVTVTITPI